MDLYYTTTNTSAYKIKMVTSYMTTDGKIFKEHIDAIQHQFLLDAMKGGNNHVQLQK